MKICTLQIAFLVTFSALALAHTNHAQILDKKITISLKEVPIEQALETIERLTNVKFFYSLDQLNIRERITFNAVDQSLSDVLDTIFEPHGITYRVHERTSTITLKKKKKATSPGGTKGPAELPRAGEAHTQAETVMGKVSDAATGNPMAGVNVIVRNTTIGTTTDANGSYSIRCENTDVLVFSFIGYITVEEHVAQRSVIDMAMEIDVTRLKEIQINAGYYTTTELFQTGNIQKVAAKDIEKQPVLNLLATLQAKVPGLEIIQATGVPGGNFKVRIRGQNSIASGNDPLYIIDGVPFISSPLSFSQTSGSLIPSGTSPLNGINPADIESVEVLKDADATAIYGSRGSNGVILITTKRGKEGDLKVDVKWQSGIGRLTNMPQILNTSQYIEMRNEAFKNDNANPTASTGRDLLLWDTTRYTDWQKVLVGGTAKFTDAQFSISGGNTLTQFLMANSYHRETTVFPGDNSDSRASVHFSVNSASSNQKLKLQTSATYSVNNSDIVNQNLMSVALRLSPNAPEIYNDDGDLNWVENGGTWTNPLSYTLRKFLASTKTLIGNSLLSYDILPGVQLKTSLGYTTVAMNAMSKIPKRSYNPAFSNSIPHTTIFSNRNIQNWIVEPQLNLSRTFGDSRVDVLLGATFQDQKMDGLVQFAEGFPSEAMMEVLKAASYREVMENTQSSYRYEAFFGRINLNFRDRYLVNVTGRRDGSSRFGPGKQFSTFAAIGAAWIFSNEPFIENSLAFLSLGKVRVSYGTTGNDQIGDYQYLDTYSPSGSYQGVTGLKPLRLFNPDFGWETNKKIEGAIDLGFMEDRIVLKTAYYINRSSNQLLGLPLPPTAGFPSIQSNLPAKIQNKGIEIEVTTHNVRRENFSWYTTFNITVPENKLLEYPGIETSPYANTYVVGRSVYSRKLYKYIGVNSATGIFEYEDVNGDGNFSTADLQVVKDIGTEYFGGLHNTISFKGIDLDVSFQFVKQTGYDPMLSAWDAAGSMANQPVSVLDRWQAPGDKSDTQRFTASFSPAAIAYSFYYNSSERAVVDASFVRLKNISLSYSLPQNVLAKLHARSLTLFLRGQNILTLTGYAGIDPESQQIVLPPLKVFTGGLQLGF